ncbi:MAG TPA: RsmB/NOP family class I SAM-dependent RNA methyltransferase [Candidatus Absconditabacterales bacterium]|nr:RsmB/NOP family class I SAM-dependent RNA methyltransferase [Candidatus Absconditabacterales bacterium]
MSSSGSQSIITNRHSSILSKRLSKNTTLVPLHEQEAFLQSLTTPLPKSITLIPINHDILQTIDELKELGFGFKQSKLNPLNRRLDPTTKGQLPLGKTPGHVLGHFYIQETAASLPASLLPIPDQGIILDMCASPGGKTIQLAQRVKSSHSKAVIRANESERTRMNQLINNIQRCCMDNVLVTNYDGRTIGQHYPESVECVLLDAPCSGEGMFFKADTITHWNEHRIHEIAHLQYELLVSAYKACKVGGTIIYSTCTMNDIENEQVISRFEEQFLGNVAIIQTRRLWPHKDYTGGFFLCEIKKLSSKQDSIPIAGRKISTTINHLSKQSNLIQLPSEIKNTILSWLDRIYKITLPSHVELMIKDDTIYHSSPHCINHLSLIKPYFGGIPVIKGTNPSNWRLLHHAGILRLRDKTFTIELTHKQYIDHINGYDMELTADQSNDYLSLSGHTIQCIYGGIPIGITKIIGSTLKNKCFRII